MSCCRECGRQKCCRRRRRHRRCCRSGVRIPKALVLGIILALLVNNLGPLLNPVANNNINIINLNSNDHDRDECDCECDHHHENNRNCNCCSKC